MDDKLLFRGIIMFFIRIKVMTEWITGRMYLMNVTYMQIIAMLSYERSWLSKFSVCWGIPFR